ncbi:hypothetical protein TI05_19300, partial [Achromatium sp. WMS3]
QPRVKTHIQHLDDLITKLEAHIRLQLAKGVDISNTAAIVETVDKHQDTDLSLADLSARLDQDRKAEPVDSQWLRWVTQILEQLKHLKWLYTEGQTNQGRTVMGMLNSTGCSSVWGSTFPYNPYPFPWSSHLFQDSTSVALGIFEGHMVKMATGFKAIRMAELELAGKYNPSEHDNFFTYFTWRNFSNEEWLLCPPVVAMGGDGSMYDIGFQNLSRVLASGTPVKVMV